VTGQQAPKWAGMRVLVSARKADVPDADCPYAAQCVMAKCSECGDGVHHDPRPFAPGNPVVIVCERCAAAAVGSGELPPGPHGRHSR
jgi:hypothetical protein